MQNKRPLSETSFFYYCSEDPETKKINSLGGGLMNNIKNGKLIYTTDKKSKQTLNNANIQPKQKLAKQLKSIDNPDIMSMSNGSENEKLIDKKDEVIDFIQIDEQDRNEIMETEIEKLNLDTQDSEDVKTKLKFILQNASLEEAEKTLNAMRSMNENGQTEELQTMINNKIEQ